MEMRSFIDLRGLELEDELLQDPEAPELTDPDEASTGWLRTIFPFQKWHLV